MVEVGKLNLADFFPVLKIFDPQGIKYRLTIHFDKVLKLFQGMISERLEQKKLQGMARNDILGILLAMSRENPEEIDRPLVEHMCLDLFAAGTDTTASTLEWAMTELLKKPEILKKAKKELTQVVGEGKQIKESEIARLSYLQCIVKETLRLHPTALLLLPRTMEQDVQLSGYVIPKRSQVFVNARVIGGDPNVSENSLIFKLERFWKSNVDVRGGDFEVIPFGDGRKICPGMPFAIRMVPLMLGSLLNSFDWKLEEGIAPDQLDMEETFGITLRKAIPLKAIPISV